MELLHLLDVAPATDAACQISSPKALGRLNVKSEELRVKGEELRVKSQERRVEILEVLDYWGIFINFANLPDFLESQGRKADK